MIHIDLALARLRAYLSQPGKTRTRLAIDAGVPEGCVRNIDSEDWNPRIKTFKKLEEAIPENFTPKNGKGTRQ